MREHMGLFRGKRIDKGEWVEGTPFFACGCCKMITAMAVHPEFVDEGNVYYAEGYPVDPDTVGECTGLRDKNGKLIFEGDILQREGCGKSGVVHTAKYHEIYGMWYVGSRLRGQESMSLLAPTRDLYEIIGTIHDKEVCDESK